MNLLGSAPQLRLGIVRLVLAERLASSLGVVNAIGWLEAVDLSQRITFATLAIAMAFYPQAPWPRAARVQWAAVAAGALVLAGRGAALVHSYSTAPAAQHTGTPEPLPINFKAEAAAYGLMVVMHPGADILTVVVQVMVIMLSCAPFHMAAILMSPTKLYLTADISQEAVNYCAIVTFLMCLWPFIKGTDSSCQSAGAHSNGAEQGSITQQQLQQQPASAQSVVQRRSSAGSKAQALLLHISQPHCAYFLATHVLALMFIVAFLLDQRVLMLEGHQTLRVCWPSIILPCCNLLLTTLRLLSAVVDHPSWRDPLFNAFAWTFTITGRLVICSLQPLDFRPNAMWRCYAFFLMLAMGTSPTLRSFTARVALACALYSTAQAWSLGQAPGAGSLTGEDGSLTVSAALSKGPLLLRAVLGVPEFSLTALAACAVYMHLPHSILVGASSDSARSHSISVRGLIGHLFAGSNLAAVCVGASLGLLACGVGIIKGASSVPRITPAFVKQVASDSMGRVLAGFPDSSDDSLVVPTTSSAVLLALLALTFLKVSTGHATGRREDHSRDSDGAADAHASARWSESASSPFAEAADPAPQQPLASSSPQSSPPEVPWHLQGVVRPGGLPYGGLLVKLGHAMSVAAHRLGEVTAAHQSLLAQHARTITILHLLGSTVAMGICMLRASDQC